MPSVEYGNNCDDHSKCPAWYCKVHGSCQKEMMDAAAASFYKRMAEQVPLPHGKIVDGKLSQPIPLIPYKGPEKHHEPTKRRKVFEKTGGKCYLCDQELDFRKFTIDHVNPRAKGGTNHAHNLMPSCHRCNFLKGDKIIDVQKFRETIIALDKRSKEEGTPQFKPKVRKGGKSKKVSFQALVSMPNSSGVMGTKK